MGTSKVVSLVAGDRKIVILRGQFWVMPSSVAVGLLRSNKTWITVHHVKTKGIRPKEPSDAPPQKPLSRSCAHDLRHAAQAGQGGAGLSPCPGCPCGGRGSPYLYRLRDLPLGQFCPAEMGAALCAGGAPGLAGSSTLRSPTQNHVRAGTAPQSPR